MQLEEEDADDGEELESDNPDGIEGVTEEFMVRLARAVKMLRRMKGTAIIAAALNTLSIIVLL